MLAGLRPDGYFICDANQRFDREWPVIVGELPLREISADGVYPTTIFQFEGYPQPEEIAGAGEN